MSTKGAVGAGVVEVPFKAAASLQRSITIVAVRAIICVIGPAHVRHEWDAIEYVAQVISALPCVGGAPLERRIALDWEACNALLSAVAFLDRL
jgi:hypothetical protein